MLKHHKWQLCSSQVLDYRYQGTVFCRATDLLNPRVCMCGLRVNAKNIYLLDKSDAECNQPVLIDVI